MENRGVVLRSQPAASSDPRWECSEVALTLSTTLEISRRLRRWAGLRLSLPVLCGTLNSCLTVGLTAFTVFGALARRYVAYIRHWAGLLKESRM